MDSLSAQAQAQVQSNLNALGTSAKAQIQAQTGVDLNNQRVQQGATSALGLLQHGYDPSSDADSAELIHAIAGGCALIPGGAVFGAYVELMWQVGNQVACPLENAFAQIGLGQASPACGGAPCTSSGGWTAQTIIDASSLPANWNAPGSFSSLAVGALATCAAKGLNCKGGTPPGLVIDAVVAIWNKTHAGPPVQIWIPPLGLAPGLGGGSPVLIPFWQNVSSSTTGSVDPNVYYAFKPVSDVPTATLPAVAYTLGGSTPPQVVSINSGPAVVPAGVTPPKTTTAAGHASALVLGVAAGGLLNAWVTGKAVDKVFGGAWDIVAGWVKGGLGAVEGGMKVSMAAGESLGRRGRRRRHAASRR